MELLLLLVVLLLLLLLLKLLLKLIFLSGFAIATAAAAAAGGRSSGTVIHLRQTGPKERIDGGSVIGICSKWIGFATGSSCLMMKMCRSTITGGAVLETQCIAIIAARVQCAYIVAEMLLLLLLRELVLLSSSRRRCGHLLQIAVVIHV